MKLFCIIFIGLFGSSAYGVVSDSGSMDFASIQQNIDQFGVSSVIVEYESLVLSNGYLSNLNDDALMATVDLMRAGFRSSLSQRTLDSIQMEYDYVPGLVANVSDVELEELKQNPFVKKIYSNRLNTTHLGESLDIVYPRKSRVDIDGGDGWTVAVIDTGVDKSHSFFRTNGTNRVISEACYSGGGFPTSELRIDRLCPGNAAATTASGSGFHCTGYEGCDHGTHVAGIAAGNDGVASGANILAIQVFTGFRDIYFQNICETGFGANCISAFDSDIIAGLNRVYALRNTYKIAAVNMSLGSGYFSSACNGENSVMTNIISQLKSVGIATTVSSGNGGFSFGISYPACISNAIAVGATSDFDGFLLGSQFVTDERTSYSNNSAQLDIYAPGSLIRSSVPGNQFDNFNGTSMAAPHVAAAFAILKQALPNASIESLEATLKSVGPTVSHQSITRRRLDILAALEELGVYTPLSITPVLQLLLDD
ncbi:MAG: S8 family serine peptidase [Acidiferrobacterales bacterium]|nr:S8 family serine peptidase [Acidiferrobacterales bacterium]